MILKILTTIASCVALITSIIGFIKTEKTSKEIDKAYKEVMGLRE